MGGGSRSECRKVRPPTERAQKSRQRQNFIFKLNENPQYTCPKGQKMASPIKYKKAGADRPTLFTDADPVNLHMTHNTKGETKKNMIFPARSFPT